MKFRRLLLTTAAVTLTTTPVLAQTASPGQTAPNAQAAVASLLAKNTFVQTKTSGATAECPASTTRRWVDLNRPVSAVRTQTSWSMGGTDKIVNEQREVGSIIWTTDLVAPGCTAKSGPLIWTRVPKNLVSKDPTEGDTVVTYLKQFTELPVESTNPTANADGTVDYSPTDLYPLQSIRVNASTGTIVATVGATPETASTWTLSDFGVKHKVAAPTVKERSLTSTKLVYKLR